MKLRQSTADYFADAGLRNAVHDLRENARSTSKGMQWNEYSQLVAAWLAAEQVVADYALSLNDCWEEIWGRCKLEGLTTLDVDYVIDNDDALRDPESVWSEEWIGRYLSLNRATKVWLGVGFEDRRVRIAIWPARNDKLLKLSLPDFEFDRDWTSYVSSHAAEISSDGTIELEPFAAIADRALALVRSSA